MFFNSRPNGSGFEAESNLKSFLRASRAAISSAIPAVSPGAGNGERKVCFSVHLAIWVTARKFYSSVLKTKRRIFQE